MNVRSPRTHIETLNSLGFPTGSWSHGGKVCGARNHSQGGKEGGHPRESVDDATGSERLTLTMGVDIKRGPEATEVTGEGIGERVGMGGS